MQSQRPSFKSRVISRCFAAALALGGCLGVGSENKAIQAISFGLLCAAIGAGAAGEVVSEGDESEALSFWETERQRAARAQLGADKLNEKIRGELESKIQRQNSRILEQSESLAALELELERLHKIQRWTVGTNSAPPSPVSPATRLSPATDLADYQRAIQQQFVRVYRARLFAAVRRASTELHQAIEREISRDRDRNDSALAKLQGELSHKIRHDWRLWIKGLDWLPHESPKQVFSDCCDIGEQIAGELAAMKVRFRNSLNISERRELLDLRKTHRETVRGQLQETIATVGSLDSQRQELEETWTAVATDAEQQISNLVGEIERLRLELAREQQRSKMPILWEPAIGPYQQCGNAIITAMAREGVILHRGLIRPQGHQAAIAFHNVSGSSLDTLNSLTEPLQQLTGALKPVSFSRAESGLLECTVQLQPKPAAERLPRFCKGDSAFAELVQSLSQKASCYVMGASGSGKSSVVRLMLNELAQTAPVVIHLHDPLDGSEEDRWNLAKRSVTATATAEALDTLSQRMQARDFASFPTAHIFDEIDLAMSLEHEGAAVKKALLKVAKTIRHAKAETAIVIGQSPTVGGKGLQWSDIDNFSALYVGGSASHAISKSPRLAGRKAELLAQFGELEDYCQGRNQAEHIDPKSAHAYRFALASIEGESPQWFLLPSFGSSYPNRSNLLDSGVQPPGFTRPASKSVQAETLVLSEFPDLSKNPSSISAIGVAEKLEKAPICPKCQVAATRRKGRSGNRWHCDNAGCDRQSFTAQA
jgi:hypothetical protein